MQNVNKFVDKFIGDIKLTESLINLKPTTSSGSLFKINTLNHIKENALSIKFVVGLVMEGVKCDDIVVKQLMTTLTESINNKINAVTIAHLCESLSNRDNAIANTTVNAIDSVILESEIAIGVSVLSGELSKFKNNYVDLRNIESKVIQENAKTMNKVETNDFALYSPMSYVTEMNGANIVRVENSIFAITENDIIQTNSPSELFIALSESAKAIQFDVESGIGSLETALGKLIIENKTLKRDVDGVVSVVENASIINEYASAVANHQIQKTELNKLDCVIAVVENIDDYKVLKNFKVVKNNLTRDIGVIIEHSNVIYCGVLESNRSMKSFSRYTTIVEAITYLKNTIGVDATPMYEDSINAEREFCENKKEKLQKIDNQINTLNDRRNIIAESLKTTTDGSEANEKYNQLDITVSEAIVKLTKERKVIESMVNEGKKADKPKYKEGVVISYKKAKDEDGDTFTPTIYWNPMFGEFMANFGYQTDPYKDLELAKRDMIGAGFKIDKIVQESVNEGKKADKPKYKVGDNIKYKTAKESGEVIKVTSKDGIHEYLVKYADGKEVTLSNGDDIVKESVNESGEKDGDAYKKFFQSMLKKFNVKEPDELEGEEKTKFFDAVDKGWKSDEEEEDDVKNECLINNAFNELIK